MNGRTSRVPRLVVGISRSPASWWALAWAVGEARRRGARLLLVHVYRPRFVSAAETSGDYGRVCLDPNADRAADGNALIWAAIGEALGRKPRDVDMEQVVLPGRPAAQLARLAAGGDLLVLGARHRGPLRRLAPGSVGRACARRASCPVMIVPEPSPAALRATLPANSMPADSARGHWPRWVPHHVPHHVPNRVERSAW